MATTAQSLSGTHTTEELFWNTGADGRSHGSGVVGRVSVQLLESSRVLMMSEVRRLACDTSVFVFLFGILLEDLPGRLVHGCIIESHTGHLS